MDRAVEGPSTAALIIVLLTASLASGCGDDSVASGAGGSGASQSGPVTDGSTGSGSTATTTAGGGDGGSGATSSGQGGGGGGEGGATGLTPWEAPIERCGDSEDDDADGRADEDCAPSFFGGVFVPAGVGLGDPAVLDAIETATRMPLSVVQTYRSTSAAGAANARADLAAIWARGSTPHLNVEPLGYAKAQFVNAAEDPELAADVGVMAAAVADALAAAPGRRLLLTFGAEMNGNWTDWGCLGPADFVAFYRWAHGVFDDALAAASIDPRRMRWAFGPNNVSSGGCGSPAAYYPGHAFNDVLGMSAYRSGTQTVAAAVLTPAHRLLDDLAMPEAWQRDRFVLLQTGTRDEAGDDRDAWIRGLFAELESDPIVRGAIYFDAAEWAVASSTAGEVTTTSGYQGLVDALAAAPVADAQLEGLFDPFFWDVPFGDPSYPEVQSLRAAELTAGCATAPPRFCPDEPLRRGDAVTLIERAFGSAPDLPGDPSEPISRRAFASALARAAGVAAGAAPGQPFDDLGVDDDDGALQALGAVGHLDGCAPNLFCPEQDALRAEGARWLVRTAGVSPPAPL